MRMNIKALIKKIKKLGFKLGFMKFIGYEAIFSCAFKKHGEDEYHFLPHTDRYWYADPLLFSHEGRDVVFMERVDRTTGIGAIVCSDITEGQWTNVIPVIEERFHMSFPMCFIWDGDIYMVPETEMDQSIHLYRCLEFPYRWESAGRYLEGRRLVDTVVEQQSGNYIRFLSSEYAAEDDFYTRFFSFTLEKDEDGKIRCMDERIRTERYTLQSRMAGYLLRENGSDIYPVQRSTPGIYGYSVMFRENDPSEGNVIKEILPSDISIKGKKLIGVHTFSRTERFEAIDVQYLDKKRKHT